MIASAESDLYACGRRVQYIPSPSLSPRASSSSSKRGHEVGHERPGAATKEHSHRTPKQLPPLNNHLKELGKSLDFNDEVVTDISPHLLSYAKSKKRDIKCLFRPDDLGIKTYSRPPRNAPIGRHNCRGDMKRHLPCHLVESPSRHTNRGIDDKNGVLGSRHYSTDLNLPTGSVTKTTNKTGIYMAPSTKSVLWEDETLGKVSSYTARRLTGKPSNISIEDSSRSLLLNRQSRSSIVKNASNLSCFDMYNDSEGLVSPPPRDYLTEFQDGARPVHQKMADRTKLVLDSGAKFDAVVEDSFPYSPTEWCGAAGEAEKKETKIENVRGYRKWLDFPQPAQTSEDLLWACHDVSVLPPSQSSESTLISRSQGGKNKELFDIMHEWHKKWQLHLQLKDVADHNSILADLQNVCETTRMLAITSIALLAEHRALSEMKLSPSSSSSSSAAEKHEMVEALTQQLKDTTEHVRVPSAITLYCMDKQNEQAEKVLLAAISGANAVESWASVQVLAIVGVTTLAVVEVLLHHLQDHSGLTARRASQLLASLSSKTHLVHSLISESLNCSGWLERLAACQMMPKLYGGINKDVCQKLVYLAWNDWSPEVRTGASQALGLTGHGKMIHDEVGRRLTDASEIIRLDALKKLHSLHLMTAQLLPPFLSCFSDTLISIRIQAVKMAGALKLTHNKVRDTLLSLLTHDSSWKVKVATLQAIAECGVVDEGLVAQLVWVIRFEKLGNVRAEGCRTIGRLGLKEEKVVCTLRDLLTVEDDPDVKSEVTRTLEQLGSREGPEDDMLEMICSEVKRLGTQETITAAVLGSDRNTITHKAILGAMRPELTTRDRLNYTGPRALTHRQDSSRECHTTSNALTTETTTLDIPPSTLRSPSVQSDSSTRSLRVGHTDTGNPAVRCNAMDIVAASTKEKLPDIQARRHKNEWSPDREGIDGLLGDIRTSLDMDSDT